MRACSHDRGKQLPDCAYMYVMRICTAITYVQSEYNRFMALRCVDLLPLLPLSLAFRMRRYRLDDDRFRPSIDAVPPRRRALPPAYVFSLYWRAKAEPMTIGPRPLITQVCALSLCQRRRKAAGVLYFLVPSRGEIEEVVEERPVKMTRLTIGGPITLFAELLG